MDIREIRKSELNDLLELYTHLHEVDDPLPARSILEKTWLEILTDRRLKYFGGFQDGALVVSCTLSVIPNLTRGCRPYGVIENVVTHPAFRRRGFGKAILRHALNEAWNQGCYKVMLLTGRKNEATFRFYEAAGFDRNAKQAFLAKP